MGTFQPLYYSAGRYSSSTDRKLLAALIDPESDGKRVAGVIPGNTANSSLKVTASANQVSVAPGLCVIPDATAPTVNSGLFLAGVISSAETAAFPTNGSGQKVHTVYGVVDDTPFVIINKKVDSATSVVTLTTATEHGFAAGQTVVVTGVDDFYDGQYQIATVPTTTTFTYQKSASSNEDIGVFAEVRQGVNWAAVTTKKIDSANLVTLTFSTTANEFSDSSSFSAANLITVKGVDSVIDGVYKPVAISSTQVTFYLNKNAADIDPAVTITNKRSSVAVARVPFKIAVELQGGTVYSTKTKIELATITLPSGANTPSFVGDRRVFAAAAGGTHLFTPGTSLGNVPGRIRYNIESNKLQYYTSTWNDFLELDATLTDATKAAPGNHNHGSVYALSNHTHGIYALATHSHTAAQISGLPGNLPAPVSVGKLGSSTSPIVLSNSSGWANVDGGSIAVNFTVPAGTTGVIALVEYAAQVVPSTSGAEYYIGVSVGGVSPEPSTTGTGSNKTFSTDGTAYNVGDLLIYPYTSSSSGLGYSVKNASRVVRFAPGTTSVVMQYKATGSGGANLFFPVIRIMPLVFYTIT